MLIMVSKIIQYGVLFALRRSKFVVLCFISLMLIVWSSPASALEHERAAVKLDSGTKYVSYVQYHPSENLMLRPAIAEGGVGSTSSLEAMAESHQAVAAINGTYFNAYDAADLHPMGAIMIDRDYTHIRGGSIVMGVTASGELAFSFENYLRIEGTINGSSTSKWYASFINHGITSPEEKVIFTPDYREQQLSYPGVTFIVVTDGVVTSIQRNAAQIPDNGYVIAIGTRWVKEADKFQIGDNLEYSIDSSLVTDIAQHLISVGPKLITNGEIDVDMARDGFTDPKMTTLSAGRSYIGSKADGTIVFGTVANVTIPELARLMLHLGLSEAMNLDGGASSGLYYDGQLLSKPGRLLSNSLVVVAESRTPRIQVNGQEQFFSGKPYIHEGVMMAPAELLESLGVTITWDASSRMLSGVRLSERVQFTERSQTAVVNGEPISLPAAPVMREDTLFIPLRFAVEALGAKIHWDGERYLANIESELMSADQHYDTAIQLWSERFNESEDSEEREIRLQETIEHLILATRLDPGHEAAQSELTRLGRDRLESSGNSCPPSKACIPLAWSEYRAGNLLLAMESFLASLEIAPDAARAHFGLALIYQDDRYLDRQKSEEHLRKVIELSPDSDEAKQAAGWLRAE